VSDPGPVYRRATSVRRRRAALGAAVLAATLAIAGCLVPASASTAAAAVGTGYLRVAHLSADTPAADVYLTSYDQPKASVLLRGVTYGQVSAYRRVAAGMYTVAMRAPGAAPGSEPILAGSVTVAASRSYTVAALGRRAALEVRVINDELKAPRKGSARARVVQAASLAPEVDVERSGSSDFAEGAKFATSTRYSDVRAGRSRVRVVPVGGSARRSTKTVTLKAGTVYTLFVLDQGSQVTVVPVVDAAGLSTAPQGGVDTGLGGGARSTPPVPGSASLLAVLGASLIGFGLLRRRGAAAR